MNESKRKKLLMLLVEHSLSFVDVILSSGRGSRYYIDGKMTATTTEGAPLIADLIKEKIGDAPVDAVGGLTIGADPMLGALSGKGYFKTFYIRKEPKAHGLHKFIEGQLSENDKTVVIIDDVATTGGSILNAINRVKEAFPHANIEKIIVLVDREEGAKENLEKQGYTLECLFTGRELLKASKEGKKCNQAA